MNTNGGRLDKRICGGQPVSVDSFIYTLAGLGLGLAILIGWIQISGRSQKIKDQEREEAINRNRESLLEVRKENEMLLQRIEKSEKLENELRLLLKDSENEGARLIAKIEELNRRLSEKQKENEESAKWLQEKFEHQWRAT